MHLHASGRLRSSSLGTAQPAPDPRPAPPTPPLQLILRLNSHDYPQLAASMAVPVLAALWQKLFGKEEF